MRVTSGGGRSVIWFRVAISTDGIDIVLAINPEPAPHPADIHTAHAPITHEARFQSFRQH